MNKDLSKINFGILVKEMMRYSKLKIDGKRNILDGINLSGDLGLIEMLSNNIEYFKVKPVNNNSVKGKIMLVISTGRLKFTNVTQTSQHCFSVYPYPSCSLAF